MHSIAVIIQVNWPCEVSMMKWNDKQTCQNSKHSPRKEYSVVHSITLVTSLWRVFSNTLSSQADIPSLTTVVLDKREAFSYWEKDVHVKSSSSSSPSFLDITPALQQYLSCPLSFTHSFQSSSTLSSLLYIAHSLDRRKEERRRNAVPSDLTWAASHFLPFE